MGKNEKICEEIDNILGICRECASMRHGNSERIGNIIRQIEDLEERFCTKDPTHYDCKKVLEDLVEKENAFINEMGMLILIAALRELRDKYD